MVLVGVPYSTPSLSNTKGGGTPYGASHIGGEKNNSPISDDEKSICITQGVRLAEIAKKLNSK